ncbi:MAG: FecR family protein [Planctomycetota bacterium]|jgi:hypothetical protein
MRKILLAAWFVPLLIGCRLFPVEIGSVEEGTGMVQRAGYDQWKEAEMDSVLLERDAVKTGSRESLVMKIPEGLIVLNEKTRLNLRGLSPEGFRQADLLSGDLFVLAEKPEGEGLLLTTGAGTVLMPAGIAILRMDPINTLEVKPAAGEAPEVRLQIVVLRGEVVLENLGFAQRLLDGQLGFLVTGSPPTTPVRLSPEVVKDYEWALDQTLRRPPRPAWARPPLHHAPQPPVPKKTKKAAASDPGKKGTAPSKGKTPPKKPGKAPEKKGK